MAAKGLMPTGSTIQPLAGITHFATKQAMAPKQRQNMLNVRVAPLKRLTAQENKIKPGKLVTGEF